MKILKQNGELVFPGEILATGDKDQLVPSFGTFKFKNCLKSKFIGIVNVSEKIRVIPFSSTYIPKVGDLVIGIVEDVRVNNWNIDINAPALSKLPISKASIDFVDETKMERYLKRGDTILAKIYSVTYDKTAFLSMKEPVTRKLFSGRLLEFKATEFYALMTSKLNLFRAIKKETKCNAKIAKNGRLWVDGPPEGISKFIELFYSKLLS
jgi:exosome complex component RRP4